MQIGANTKIKLEDFTDEYLRKIVELYRSLGFPCNDNVLDGVDANFVKKEVSKYNFLELRPAPATDSHLIFEIRYGGGNTPYLHLVAQKDKRWRILYKMDDEHFANLSQDFDNAMREAFC